MSKKVLDRTGEGTDLARAGKLRRIRRFVRRHRLAAFIAGVLALGFVLFVLFWFQPQKLFLNKTVNEGLPGAIETPGQATTTPGIAGGGTGTTPGTVQKPPAPMLTVLASGSFRSLEHGTTGKALVLRRSDGALILRFENLQTSNGPQLHVYLSEISSSGGLHDYGERFIDLGPLKGNIGSQNYAIPKGTDLSKFQSAVIWCTRFKVGFGVAGLPQLASL